MSRDVALGVSHNQVFYAPHAEAKRLIDAGAIGQPVLIRLRLGMGPSFGGWRDSPALTGGGLLFDAGVASVAAYLDAVTAGQEPPVTGAAAMETMRLLHRIYDSAIVLHGGSRL
jgi:predicted dehydrogenase